MMHFSVPAERRQAPLPEDDCVFSYYERLELSDAIKRLREQDLPGAIRAAGGSVAPGQWFELDLEALPVDKLVRLRDFVRRAREEVEERKDERIRELDKSFKTGRYADKMRVVQMAIALETRKLEALNSEQDAPKI